jgi:hypothetical protein
MIKLTFECSDIHGLINHVAELQLLFNHANLNSAMEDLVPSDVVTEPKRKAGRPKKEIPIEPLRAVTASMVEEAKLREAALVEAHTLYEITATPLKQSGYKVEHFTKDDVKAAAQRLVDKTGGYEEALALLEKYGVKTIGNLDPSHYAAYIAELDHRVKE